MQNVDDRTKKQIVEQIKEKSDSYVPQWRFDQTNPDIGTAVALVYAELFSKTLKRLNQVPLKNRIAFLNELDAKLLPAVPAEGFVSFSLVNDEVEGVEVNRGTIVNAQSEQDEVGVVSYKTVDDVFVSPAKLENIYLTCDRTDTILRVWNEGDPEEPFVLFEQRGVNLQEHQFYFCHNEAFYIRGEGFIQISFLGTGQESGGVPESFLDRLADRQAVRFSYYTEDGYREFDRQEKADGTLIFHKGKDQPEFSRTTVGKTEGYFIRCTAMNIEEMKDFSFEHIRVRSYGKGIIPDSVYANGAESAKKRFFPFGERLTDFGEVYFASEEALCKKGADIELAFNLDFAKIPLDFNIENDPVKWQWVMKASDFRPNPEFDVTIDSVIWEYYNGKGWARLFPDERYEDLFYPKGGTFGEYKRIHFVCPGDITKLTINSCESYYIRARIVKVNNFYKMKGAYISPILENTIFGYDYKGREVFPDGMLSWNNQEYEDFLSPDVSFKREKRPFIQTGEERPVLYLGFNRGLEKGPLKFFFLLKDNVNRKKALLLWEYFDGKKWREMNLVDETQHFGKSGIVTFMGGHHFEKKRLFGKDLYWIRMIDEKNSYHEKNRETEFPVLQGLFPNTTKILNVDAERTEYFQMELYQENMRFSLLGDRIVDAQLRINELDELDEEELKALDEEGRLLSIYDDAGVMTEAWILWEETEDFVEAGPEDRIYVLDRNEGYLIFGNGKRGKIPPSSRNENIRVDYRQGGGEHTNVPEGRVNQMDQEIGFINAVRNPVALMGGCGIEALSDALKRNGAAIRHQNRAVTARDFEELALTASRSIQRVKCFAGYNERGRKQPGAVTLVVLQKNYEKGKTQFNGIKNEIETYLEDKISGDLLAQERLFIVEPEFVYMDVRMELVVRDFNQVFSVRKQVQERLAQFLHPFSGNFHGKGWEIGKLPGNIQLKNAIADIPGLAMIKNIYISAFADESKGRKEIDLEKGTFGRYLLPVSGEHEITIQVG